MSGRGEWELTLSQVCLKRMLTQIVKAFDKTKISEEVWGKPEDIICAETLLKAKFRLMFLRETKTWEESWEMLKVSIALWKHAVRVLKLVSPNLEDDSWRKHYFPQKRPSASQSEKQMYAHLQRVVCNMTLVINQQIQWINGIYIRCWHTIQQVLCWLS